MALKLVIVICTFIILAIMLKIITNKPRFKYMKRELTRKIRYSRNKYFYKIIVVKQALINILIFSFCIGIVILFFLITKIVYCENNTIIFNLNNELFKEHCYDFLWSQISSSMIISTVVTLLSIFSENYIYGQKQINVIFSRKSLLSLGKLFCYLTLLIFGSLGICLIDNHYFILLANFIISTMIIFYMLFKIILFYTHPFLYNDIVKCDYINAEKKHIKLAKPLEPHKSQDILNLKLRTNELIQKGDSEYNINIDALFDMIEISLLNNAKKVQEYYTEMIYRTDFITSLLEIIIHLIKYNKLSEASYFMRNLYYRLKYYRIVLIQDYFSYNIISSLIKKGKYIDDELLAREHFKILWEIINCEIYFVYLYYNELDLSYCRLGKYEDMIYYLTKNNFLEELYIAINENMKLTDKEKERIFDELYDNIRMMEHKEQFPDLDIRNYERNEKINKNKINIPVIIKGEPIVLMMLKMFEEEDIDNLNLYRTMNLSNNLMNYIVILVSMSLIKFLNQDCKREYVNDLKMSKEQILTTYKNTNFNKIKYSRIELSELYEVFIGNYIKYEKKRPYILLPRLTLSKEIIDTYFYYLYLQNNELKFFQKLTKNKSYKPNQNIINKIKELNM